MNFNYSQEIDSTVYETHGLDGGIPLRIHKDQHLEFKGALRAQRDWTKHVNNVNGYRGGLGDPFSFISVTVPECLPDRLELISYANEFAFLYDDKMESFDLKKDLEKEATKMLDAFGDGALDRRVNAKSGPEKRLQAQMLSEMLSFDPERAVTSMKAWAKFVQLASRTRSSAFETLDEYVPSRVIDAGELIWFGTLTFGMALTIPDDEYEICMEMARPGYAALGLTNDLFSWEKERHDAMAAGQDYVFNAIWVIMKEKSVTEAEAKIICCSEIEKYVSTFRQTVEETKHNSCLSKDLRTYLEAVLYSISGNLVWSIYCPRYREF
ncbi:isoprenoid synthase domain-containing protein [Xylaria flabelliformis]|nr:isoprenoid synthase domain-containing protein [Xylaria flabelliformis]